MQRLKRFAPALVFGLPFLVYLPTLWGTFYYDDNVIFFGHQVKVLAEDPFLVFQDKFHFLPGAPRSVHVFMLLVIYKFFGADPFSFHLLNLTLHSLTTLVIYLAFKKLIQMSVEEGEHGAGETLWGVPLLGALIFGLHPIHVENITFVTLGGTDLFYTLWASASLLGYLMFRGGTGRLRFVWLALSVGAYYLALLSKESAITFILIFPLAEFALGRRGFLWALPHAALILKDKLRFLLSTSDLITESMAMPSAQADKGVDELFKGLGYFLKSSFVPWPQSTLVKEFPNEWALYAILAATVAAAALAAWKLKKTRRVFIFSALWFPVTALPYLFTPYVEANTAVTAERYIYAPSAGFAMALALLLVHLALKERFGKAVLAVVAVVLAAYSALGVAYFYDSWRNEGAFWARAIKMNPDYVSGYVGLSSVAAASGDDAAAERLLKAGLGRPKGQSTEFSQAAYNMGLIAHRRGDLTRAESYYLLSIRYGPFEFSFTELGYLYLRVKNLKAARWSFERARRFTSRSSRATYGMAKTLSLMGDHEGARRLAVGLLRNPRGGRYRDLVRELLEETTPKAPAGHP